MNFIQKNTPFAAPMASDLRSVRRRASLVAVVLCICILGLAYRAWHVSVFLHDDYAEQGNRQQLRSYKVDASRGDIVDRGYIALAVTDRVFKVVLNPRLIRAQGAEDQVLAAILEMFPGQNAAYLQGELGRDKAYRQLHMQLDDEQAEALRSKRLPGVRLERIPHRVYPRKLLASHLVGRVNGQGKGNLGVEYGMDEYLRGRDAMSPAYFARGRKLLVDGFPDPGISRGHTVVLTIDSAIQAMAEEEINTLVANWTPVSASIVVLDPKTGEVLAMTSRPTFDPNHRVGKLEQTVNHAVQSAFEPGSTMKAVTVAAALEQGVIRKDETFFCENGKWKYTDEHSISDTKQSEWLSVGEILAVSSNIGTTKIADRLGKRSLYKWVRRFHFGERPEVELPGATAGLLAPWKKWSDIQAANISFGQGMSASPLQVASAFAALSNRGLYRKPTLVRKVLDPNGEVIIENEARGHRVVRASTAKTVMRMLEGVVQHKKGTGRNAQIDGYRVAGKTSTAQKASRSGGYEEDEYFASFVGAVPAEDAKVVILVSVDGPQGGHYGNQVAAPTFARLGARVMEHFATPRLDATEEAPKEIRLRATSKKLLEGFESVLDVEPDLPGMRRVAFTTGLPDFTGLTIPEALSAAEKSKVRLRAEGTGVAVMQDAPPGPVAEGLLVRVIFEPPK